MKTMVGTRNNISLSRLTLNNIKKKWNKSWQLYLLLIPAIIYFAVFCYTPMYGVILAFKDYIATLGIAGSPWVGFDNFIRLFNSYQFKQLLENQLKYHE